MVPPEGVRLDDGGKYLPSADQSWLWDQWEHFWNEVYKEQRRHKGELQIVYNGDLFEGIHHNTSQVVSLNPEAISYLTDRTFGVPRKLKPSKQYVVRGTEAHVGTSGSQEEDFARRIRAIADERSDAWSWWHLILNVHGVRCDFQHHGRFGSRPWTGHATASALAAEIFYEHAKRRVPHPQLAFRSHRHRYADTYTAHPVRLIQTPCWQLKTSYAHKVAPESLPDIGGIVLTVEPSGQYHVTDWRYEVPEVQVCQS